ncbi:hypothetical protein [Escherichia phage phiWec190]|uniref:hypothetical protein n=1 Tax=Escherichia coli TaxID=562 RepID=UPI001FF0F297|nr:hypothetical protein [Escherichia coli]MCJ8478817.1 hypothetical protein [Escherichia coli]BDU13307.1 hypothetical protein [Escherichia phage phiWec188]BDU13887.1 hypothetical protein [Escherichia phage phiWec190]
MAAYNWYELEAVCQFYDSIVLRDPICQELSRRASALAINVKVHDWNADLEKELEFLLETTRVFRKVFPEWFEMEE